MADDKLPPETPPVVPANDAPAPKGKPFMRRSFGAATTPDAPDAPTEPGTFNSRTFKPAEDPCATGNCGHTSHMPTFGTTGATTPPADSSAAAPTAAAAHRTEKTIGNAWKNMADDVRARLKDGINPHAKPIEHTINGKTHTHPAHTAIDRTGKICIAAGATVSLGVALHGVYNMARGMTGWEDKELGQSHAPSVTHVLVGAAETLAGAALLKRILTGTFRVF